MTISQPDEGGRPTVIDQVPAPRPHAAIAVAPPSQGDFDEPLLADAAALQASWKRLQGEFVDDPRAAVADAADLVEHTAQALIGALRLRQRQLRASWVESGQDEGAGEQQTEQLRLTMQGYRSLFSQICGP